MKGFHHAVAALLAAASCIAAAEQFPSRPVKIVVPFAPGGNLDITARLIGESMSKTLGQPFVVENRAGAGGAVGQDVVAKSTPDGYTLVAATTGTTIVSPLMIPTPPYSLADFAPIGIMAVTPLMLEVPAASPYKDFKSYLAAVKANPGKITIGHSGNGTTNHIAILELQDALKVQFNIVPYKGSGPALVDLVGGQIDSMMDQTSSSLPQVRAGKLRVIALAAPRRLAALPDIPTVAETYPQIDVYAWQTIAAPRATPPEIVGRLNTEINWLLKTPDMRDALQRVGVEADPLELPALNQLIQRDAKRFGELVRATGLHA